MFKRITLSTATYAILLSTSAHADTKFIFRYVAGTSIASVEQPTEPTEPETPEKPQGRARLEIDRGLLSHMDTNGNGVIDEGETVTATWTVRNIGDAPAQISADDANFGVRGENISSGAWASVACSSATLAPGASTKCVSSLILPDYLVDIPAEWGRENFFLSASFNLGPPYYTWQESERIPLQS